MITTKEVKVKIPEKLTSEYIESELLNIQQDILHWAITGCDDKFYTINLSVIED